MRISDWSSDVCSSDLPAGTPVGLTANSFTSVSLDPPLLLVCIANKAGTAPILRDAAHFGVNVLQIGQQPTSNRFAAKGEDRRSEERSVGKERVSTCQTGWTPYH